MPWHQGDLTSATGESLRPKMLQELLRAWAEQTGKQVKWYLVVEAVRPGKEPGTSVIEFRDSLDSLEAWDRFALAHPDKMEPKVVHRLERDTIPISCRARVPTGQVEKLQAGDIICVEGKVSHAGDASVGATRVLTLELVEGRIGFHAPAASFENP